MAAPAKFGYIVNWYTNDRKERRYQGIKHPIITLIACFSFTADSLHREGTRMSSCSRPKNCSLYVRNLPREARLDQLKHFYLVFAHFFLPCDLNSLVRSEVLRRLFSQYGRVTDVNIPLDHYTGEPRDFAYVQYPFLYLKSVILSVISISLSL